MHGASPTGTKLQLNKMINGHDVDGTPRLKSGLQWAPTSTRRGAPPIISTAPLKDLRLLRQELPGHGGSRGQIWHKVPPSHFCFYFTWLVKK